MLNKEFVPYEQSLALKELGFDEPCIAFYDKLKFFNNTKLCFVSQRVNNSIFNSIKNDGTLISAPLYQQAFRWFREKHGLIGQPIPLSISYPGKVTHYGWSIVSNQNSNDWENENDRFKSYEEAESACLDKLIEIVKNKQD